jgi:catechol 2,3-dioxygenase-like lactoylglutathione lyase family enzyme
MIQHVALELRREDVDACLHFWWLLGFERVAPPPALAERSVWVEAGATQVHLLFTDEPVAPPEGHVAVVVGDFDATCANLDRAGFEPEQRTQHWGSPRAFVRSPSGHRVEFMAFAPGA